MAITYTTAELVEWLKADQSCGGAWPFIIERLQNSGHTFDASLMGGPGNQFQGGEKCAYVSYKADDRFDAMSWAKDALRIWARAGVEQGGNYFPLIARDYAKNGPGKGNTAKSLGTTLDFLILLSKYGSSRANGRMLETNAVMGKDVPELFCFIYNNMYGPTSQAGVTVLKWLGKEEDNHLAAIKGENKSGPPGLNAAYRDSDYPDEDQTHHFAAYFCHGASHGLDKTSMDCALSYSHDYDDRTKKVLNQGDYYLGWLGAKWGDSFKRRPRFIGSEVEAALLAADPNVVLPVPDP